MKSREIYVALALYAVVAAAVIVLFNGIGDSGDSILHYLYSKYAFKHPELFLHHWAKPVFVLLSAPFAQFGFTGMKVFNAIVTGVTLFFTYKICRSLELKNALLTIVLLLFAPLHFVLIFSGLTEPLFAAFLSGSLYLMLRERYLSSAIVLSFLPFVRSEGLVIIAVWVFYFLLKKKWYAVAGLVVGHVVYAVVGYLFYDYELLWVFRKMPYNYRSQYGSGNFTHYFVQMTYIVGIPIYALLWLGVISIAKNTLQGISNLYIQVPILLGFGAFFMTHTMAWYLGLMGSMGLVRVLISVMPLIAIIALLGFNFITENIFIHNNKIKFVIKFVLIGYLLIFPFTPNPAAFNWEDLKLNKYDKQAIQVRDHITTNLDIDQRKFLYVHPYMSEILNIDHFDPQQHQELQPDFMQHLNEGDVVIWDFWFSVIERGVSKKMLDNSPELDLIYELKDDERKTTYAVYVKRG